MSAFNEGKKKSISVQSFKISPAIANVRFCWGKPSNVKPYLNPLFKKKQKASDENLCILGYLLETAYVMQGWGHIWVGYEESFHFLLQVHTLLYRRKMFLENVEVPTESWATTQIALLGYGLSPLFIKLNIYDKNRHN